MKGSPAAAAASLRRFHSSHSLKVSALPSALPCRYLLIMYLSERNIMDSEMMMLSAAITSTQEPKPRPIAMITSGHEPCVFEFISCQVIIVARAINCMLNRTKNRPHAFSRTLHIAARCRFWSCTGKQATLTASDQVRTHSDLSGGQWAAPLPSIPSSQWPLGVLVLAQGND